MYIRINKIHTLAMYQQQNNCNLSLFMYHPMSLRNSSLWTTATFWVCIISWRFYHWRGQTQWSAYKIHNIWQFPHGSALDIYRLVCAAMSNDETSCCRTVMKYIRCSAWGIILTHSGKEIVHVFSFGTKYRLAVTP